MWLENGNDQWILAMATKKITLIMCKTETAYSTYKTDVVVLPTLKWTLIHN